MERGAHKTLPVLQVRHPASCMCSLAKDEVGAVLIEAALTFPILILMLMGVVTYGLWFMTAHTLQQVANDAARSVLGTYNADERGAEVEKTIEHGLLNVSAIDAKKVTVKTSLDGAYYTVSLSYDTSADAIFANALIPVPNKDIVRSATVELSTP